jgi:Holliday junction resolvase RusA-like endonuclease
MIGAAAMDALAGRPPLDAPVEIALHAEFAVPPSWPQRKQQLALDDNIRPTTRPDLDNVLKNWLDGLSGVSFEDDALIVRMSQAQI